MTININAERDICDRATPGPWRLNGIDIDQLTDAGKGYPLDIYPDSHCVATGRCSGCGMPGGIAKLEDATFVAEARMRWPAAIDEIELLRSVIDNHDGVVAGLRETCDRLTARRDELLATIARISQTVLLEPEVAEALEQRGAMLAEIGTLRSEVHEMRAQLVEVKTQSELMRPVFAEALIHYGDFRRLMPTSGRALISAIDMAIRAAAEGKA